MIQEIDIRFQLLEDNWQLRSLYKRIVNIEVIA